MQLSQWVRLGWQTAKLAVFLLTLLGCGTKSKPLARAQGGAAPVTAPSDDTPKVTDTNGTPLVNPEPPIASLSTTDSESALVNIVSGSSLTLKWSSQGATSCALSNGEENPLSRALNQNGLLISNITSKTFYSLICNGPGGQAIDTVSVSIVTAAPAVSATLLAVGTTATTLNIPYNSSVTLVWWGENAASCNLKDNGTLVSSATENSTGLTLSGIIVNKVINLTCGGASGTATATLYINVDLPVATVSLAASNPKMSDVTILQGGNVLLTWNSTYTIACSVRDGTSPIATGVSNVSGLLLSNIMADKTITLQCSAANPVSLVDTVRIHVIPVNVTPPPTVDLRVNNAAGSLSVAYEASVQVSWATTNATSCSMSVTGGASIFSNVLQQSPISYGPLRASVTLALTCVGVGGSASKSVSIAVPTGKWIATDGAVEWKSCSRICSDHGYVDALSPEGAKCVSGENVAASALGKVSFKYGCFPKNCPPVSMSDAHVTINVRAYCYRDSQVQDWDVTDYTMGCFCR